MNPPSPSRDFTFRPYYPSILLTTFSTFPQKLRPRLIAHACTIAQKPSRFTKANTAAVEEKRKARPNFADRPMQWLSAELSQEEECKLTKKSDYEKARLTARDLEVLLERNALEARRLYPYTSRRPYQIPHPPSASRYHRRLARDAVARRASLRTRPGIPVLEAGYRMQLLYHRLYYGAIPGD